MTRIDAARAAAGGWDRRTSTVGPTRYAAGIDRLGDVVDRKVVNTVLCVAYTTRSGRDDAWPTIRSAIRGLP